ncbi:hypothetical protein WR25_21839 [Diploscapter pachys]|uniref:CYTH domain-containing protein n=1 Tax=Diploscapter pachys TaxID=2018661 RepID=A0A2A2LRG0_9BILA|nr:hypothetical protein WR25_21839 [Diploscapter pachys]
MSRNLEIKASVKDLNKLLELARKLTGTDGKVLIQYDVFFNSPKERLKLREVVEDGKKNIELIWYARPDTAGPKLSDYNKVGFSEEQGQEMKKLLSNSMGVKGEVRKKRHLFIYEQTRIHVDEVEELGNFMELEVCLKPEETVEQGTRIAEFIRNELQIPESDLLTSAYMDMLQA